MTDIIDKILNESYYENQWNENIVKCSNFKNCGKTWTENNDEAYQFCSKECKKYYEEKENAC